MSECVPQGTHDCGSSAGRRSRDAGEGGEGDQEQGAPRLNDQIWVYGGEKAEIVAQIHKPKHGVMPAWSGRLDPATIKLLSVYVHALGGGQ